MGVLWDVTQYKFNHKMKISAGELLSAWHLTVSACWISKILMLPCEPMFTRQCWTSATRKHSSNMETSSCWSFSIQILHPAPEGVAAVFCGSLNSLFMSLPCEWANERGSLRVSAWHSDVINNRFIITYKITCLHNRTARISGKDVVSKCLS